MKPETAAEAIAAVIHSWDFPAHEGPDCCGYFARKTAQAQKLVDGLTEIGWLPPAPAVSLPQSAPKGDAKTAAAEIEDCDDRQYAIWWLLDFYGPLTGDEIAERYDRFVKPPSFVQTTPSFRPLPPQTVESQRSRRKELERSGHVEPLLGPDGKGVRRATRNGGTAQVWQARSEAAVAAA